MRKMKPKGMMVKAVNGKCYVYAYYILLFFTVIHMYATLQM